MDEAKVLALLPPRLREIAAVPGVGVDATLQLASSRLAGVRLYVPHQVEAGHPIAEAMGLAPARALCKAFAGHSFALPLGLRYQGTLLRARVLARYYGGESAAALAREFRLHEMTVYKWAGQDKQQAAAGQSSLF